MHCVHAIWPNNSNFNQMRNAAEKKTETQGALVYLAVVLISFQLATDTGE